jgi:ATP-dependent DNA helicase RecQ
VICTMAFGIGIDCSEVRQVFHFGPPDDNATYIQETGRCGRDGLPCNATLLLKSRLPYNLELDMKRYISNTCNCRREILFNEMEGYNNIPCAQKCLCCDICKLNCSCLNCFN